MPARRFRSEPAWISIELGIVKGQGHYLGAPMALDDVAAMVNSEFPNFSRAERLP